MMTRVFPIFLVVLVSTFSYAADTVKESNAFAPDQLRVVLKNLKEFCDHLEMSETHSVYIVPKLLGSFVTKDPFTGSTEAKIDTGECGYFVEGEAAKFIEGLRKPSAVTMYDCSTSHLIILLTEKSATLEESLVTCKFVGNNKFVVRTRISQFGNGSADFVYEGEYARWVKKHFLTPAP